MLLSPYARPISGFLDLILLNTHRKRDIIRLMGDYYKGHYEKHDTFKYKRCKKIEIKSDSVMSIQMDGEAFHAKELTLEIIPGGINFFAPKELEIVDYSYKAYKRTLKDTDS